MPPSSPRPPRFFWGNFSCGSPVEPSRDLDELAYKVIGAALTVHRALGPGFLESAYETALALELGVLGLPMERQVPIEIDYRGTKIVAQRIDLLVGGALIVEIRSVTALMPIHSAQALSYLAATKRDLALLINFNVKMLRDGIKRIVRAGR